LISVLGALFAKLRGGRFCFWGMDLNPDEGIELGWVKEHSLVARMLQAFLKFSLRCSDRVIALDRFMRDRLIAKGTPTERVSVIPPWSHDQEVRYDAAGREAFRRAHGLAQKFVVMYSGNHSACHPLKTLLKAAEKLRTDERFVFCFVGGGSEFQKVKDFARTNALPNILCLPYQPMDELAGSLSAADLHVVVMGDRFAGLVHPCKVYNIVAIAAPFLYIGPTESHIADLLQLDGDGITAYPARHDDVDEVIKHIRAAASAVRQRIGPSRTPNSLFSSGVLVPQMISVLEQTVKCEPAVPVCSAAERSVGPT
jgi:colanic acid biosynthesis glycosyl transferase WcaI